MAEEIREKAFREQLDALCPTLDNLRLMLGAARHAFNRHSSKELEELAKLQDTLTLDLDTVFEKVELALKKKRQAEKPYLLRLHGILTHLEIIGAHAVALAEPIKRKTRDGVIFSDEDFTYLNNLFSAHTGLMRALVDVFKQDNPTLRTYMLNESKKLIEECFAAATDHQTRMMEGVGQPQAWSIFLSILDHLRLILRHLIDIVKLLGD